MAGSIDKSDQADMAAFVFDFGLISTDMLGNATIFFFPDIGGTDFIKQGGFAMVNMTHNGDDWRSKNRLVHRNEE